MTSITQQMVTPAEERSAGVPAPITDDPRVNTNVDFYLEQDPHELVSMGIVDFIARRAGGKSLLDLGCGIGGYAHLLQRRGFEVVAVERNPAYVRRARELGVNVLEGTGQGIPLPDKSVDTVYLVEVLEHIPSEELPPLLEELKRVARRSVLATVPDCSRFREMDEVGFIPFHFKAVDHVQFFTPDSMRALMLRFFPSVDVQAVEPLYPHRLLPGIVRRPLSLAYRLGLLKSPLTSRLLVEARLDG